MTAREAAEELTAAKSIAQALLEDGYPEEAYGSAWLEQAVGLLGRCVDECDRVADQHGERA